MPQLDIKPKVIIWFAFPREEFIDISNKIILEMNTILANL